jgi:hypothetical protein
MTDSIEIFQSEDGQLELKVAFNNDTVWLSQLPDYASCSGASSSVIISSIST